MSQTIPSFSFHDTLRRRLPVSDTSQTPWQARLRGVLSFDDPDPERTLTNFRYVVANVNEDALKVWADLWNEMSPSVTPGGMVLPEMSKGFVPPGGWPEFLEKFWLLKHYLDYVQRFCSESAATRFREPSRQE